jgi:hypothetical protein
MIGLEPHPILEYPPAEWASDPLRKADVETWIRSRAEAMAAERLDPLGQGWEPEIWHIVDDLLCDGHKVILDVSRLTRRSAPKTLRRWKWKAGRRCGSPAAIARAKASMAAKKMHESSCDGAQGQNVELCRYRPNLHAPGSNRFSGNTCRRK